MLSVQRKTEQRFCNCRNSKCMKLYCECFSAKVPCGKQCRCIDCQNTPEREGAKQGAVPQKKLSKQQLMKGHRGCACRRSGCNKKYCDCFQAGLLCKDSCKCIDCQNNESLTNRRVINQLRRPISESTPQLYPLYLSQNSDHLTSIINESNPLNLPVFWLQNCAKSLYECSRVGEVGLLMDKLVEILGELERGITEEQELAYREHDFSGGDEQDDDEMNRMGRKRRKQNEGEGEGEADGLKYEDDEEDQDQQENDEDEENSQDQGNQNDNDNENENDNGENVVQRTPEKALKKQQQQ